MTAPAQSAGQQEDREYSRKGLFGVAVPQANPIVEPEFGALMPDGVGVIATRLQGSRTDSRNRLVQYLDHLDESLEQFDTARPDALGYACTGTSYLVERDHEQRRIDELSTRFGYPILTAADAILAALDSLGLRKVAILAPYPQWMAEASHRYWQARGLEVTASARTVLDTEDTRHIYRIRTPMVMAAARGLDTAAADAVLITGTGMPSLRAILEISRAIGKPVLSSNLCLAWALLRHVQADVPPPRAQLGESLLGGWAERVASL